jgi:surfactin synthase thioesterase subunit
VIQDIELVCLPFAGGGIAAFSALGRVGERRGVAVRPTALPGREGRFMEPPVDHWPSMRDLLTAEVVPLLHPRAVLYGHSFGALLAFEACVLTERAGISPLALVAAAADGPDAPRRRVRAAERSDRRLLEEVAERTGDDRLRRLPAELYPVVLPALRADLALYDDYRPDPKSATAVPLLALCGTGDETSAAGSAAWERRARGRFALESVEGGHFFLETAPEEVLIKILAFTEAAELERSEHD